MRTAKAMIFDMNGTLFWDSEINYEAWDLCIRRWFGHGYDRRLYAKLNGRSTKETIEYLFEGSLGQSLLARYEKEEQSAYSTVFDRNAASAGLAPGALRLLENLRTRKIACGIVTSASPTLMSRYYEHFRLDRYFFPEQIICNDGSLAGKPQPDMYLAGLKALGVAPEDTIVFEDSSSGIQSAYRAGIREIYAVESPGSDTAKTSRMKETTALLKDFNHFLEQMGW